MGYGTMDEGGLFGQALGLEPPWYDFLGYRTILQAPSPRVDCPACGVRQAELPWTRPSRKLTLPFEEFVVDLAREMPVRAVARVVGEHDTRLWRVVNHYAT